jgi:hypothetical protein
MPCGRPTSANHLRRGTKLISILAVGYKSTVWSWHPPKKEADSGNGGEINIDDMLHSSGIMENGRWKLSSLLLEQVSLRVS